MHSMIRGQQLPFQIQVQVCIVLVAAVSFTD